MRENNITKMLTLPIMIAVLATMPLMMSQQKAQAATDFITVSLDGFGLDDTEEFPYGINCEASSDFVYMTHFESGYVSKINKTDGSVENVFNDDFGDDAGQDFYDIEDANDKLYIPERDNGILRIFDLSTESDWTHVPIIPEVQDTEGDNDITYTNNDADGYEDEPATLTVLDEPEGGDHTYQFGFSSWGGAVVPSNGDVYVGVSGSVDFDQDANDMGVQDTSFSGLVRIPSSMSDPDSADTTRFNITSSESIHHLTIDSQDDSIIWISDRSADNVYQFDTSTDSVTATISLPADSNPRDVATDSNNLYVALNKDSGNSTLMEIPRSDFTSQTEIDLGAAIDEFGSGTFTVFVFGGQVFWTDQSAHIGVYNPSDGLTSVTDTSGDTSSNHFACLVGSDVWFAGEGSSKIGIFSLGSERDDSGGGGDGCSVECVPPTNAEDQKGKLIVENGFVYNNGTGPVAINATEFYNHYPLIPTQTGQNVTATFKIYENSGVDNIRHVSITHGVGKEDRQLNDGIATLQYKINHQQNGTLSYLDFDQKIKRNANVTTDRVECASWNDLQCLEISFHYEFQEPIPEADIVQSKFWDWVRNSQRKLYNDGIDVYGLALNGLDKFAVNDQYGRHQLQYVDYTMENLNIAKDLETGEFWYKTEDGFWKPHSRLFHQPDTSCGEPTSHGYERHCAEFQDLIQEEIDSAISQHWNGSKIINDVPESTNKYAVSHDGKKLEDPEVRMKMIIEEMKAQNTLEE